MQATTSKRRRKARKTNGTRASKRRTARKPQRIPAELPVLPEGDVWVRLHYVEQAFGGVSRWKVNDLIAKGVIPEGRSASERIRLWIKSEIDRIASARLQQSSPGEGPRDGAP